MKKSTKNIILAGALIALPFFAHACPMCQGDTKGRTVKAYKGITLALALMPIAGSAGISYWIYNKYKQVRKK